jgi:hypothetical protein
MSARKTQAVRFLWDYAATPHKTYEAATWSDHALALFMEGEWNRPDHGEGSMVAARWGVIRRGATVHARPVWMTYDRDLAPKPWGVEDPDHHHAPQRFAQMWQAMEVAAGEVAS